MDLLKSDCVKIKIFYALLSYCEAMKSSAETNSYMTKILGLFG